MVSTRKHPRNYPPPEVAVEASATTANAGSTPAAKKSSSRSAARSKSRPRVSTAKATATPSSPAPESPTSPTTTVARSRPSRAKVTPTWSHTPSHLTLIWLAISLPLVIWDSGYVLGRPHTMPGGFLHSPLFTPYSLYGKVDYIYGQKAVDDGNGFTSAQGALNVIETIMYLAYLAIVWRNGKEQDKTTSRGRRKSTVEGRGAPSKKWVGWFGEARIVSGHHATRAVLLGLSASLMTFSKTVLYWLNEYFSDFSNIGHNSFADLVFLWIIPNGAWIVASAYMMYAFGAEIVEGLNTAGGAPVPKAIATKEE